MTSSITKYADSHSVQIFIAGEYSLAKKIAREYCDEVGCCVTVAKTTYIYTGGEEKGVVIGFINYPRFPKKPDDIELQAYFLAEKLLKGLDQQSYSIQTPDETKWISYREEDAAS
jgi:hypothetical protein